MNKLQQQRKDEHLHLAEAFYNDASAFQGIRFMHQSLPESDLLSTCLETHYGALHMSAPFFINAMTGGSKHSQQINDRLSLIAKETDLALATGSLSAAIKDDSLAPTFSIVRKNNPEGLILANIGAEHSIENAKKAIEIIQADALQIHINVAQELMMPEGGREFHWLHNIEKIVQAIDCPVIIKEVGFGMSAETLHQLQEIGVSYVDVSGTGGTNFSQIENARGKTMTELINWGQTTAESLLDIYNHHNEMHIAASGGVKSPLDVAKCLALGAETIGVSGYFLHYLMHHSDEETIAEIERWKQELRVIMTLLGLNTISEFTQTNLLLDQELAHFCKARDIDWKRFAHRIIMNKRSD